MIDRPYDPEKVEGIKLLVSSIATSVKSGDKISEHVNKEIDRLVSTIDMLVDMVNNEGSENMPLVTTSPSDTAPGYDQQGDPNHFLKEVKGMKNLDVLKILKKLKYAKYIQHVWPIRVSVTGWDEPFTCSDPENAYDICSGTYRWGTIKHALKIMPNMNGSEMYQYCPMVRIDNRDNLEQVDMYVSSEAVCNDTLELIRNMTTSTQKEPVIPGWNAAAGVGNLHIITVDMAEGDSYVPKITKQHVIASGWKESLSKLSENFQYGVCVVEVRDSGPELRVDFTYIAISNAALSHYTGNHDCTTPIDKAQDPQMI